MEVFIAVLHMLVAFVLIGLVLVQDSKSGSIGGAFGGGGAGSVFGPMGAATLAQKLTRYCAILFAATCIYLTVISASHNKTVLDNLPATPAATPQTQAPATEPPAKPVETEPGK